MAGFLAFLTPIRDIFYKENDPERAYKALEPHLNDKKLSVEERRAVMELAALIFREQKRYDDAIALYGEIADPYQAGYCEMLKGNLLAAREHWTKATELRQNHWCITLYGMVNRQLMAYPTTFEVRNHLESDINNLVFSMQFSFLENVLAYAEFLVQINPETYKFMGRSLMNSGWVDRAGDFLLKGQKVLPNDPEIYYHLGEYSEKKALYDDARLMLNQCLLISPTYEPAKVILERLPAAS